MHSSSAGMDLSQQIDAISVPQSDPRPQQPSERVEPTGVQNNAPGLDFTHPLLSTSSGGGGVMFSPLAVVDPSPTVSLLGRRVEAAGRRVQAIQARRFGTGAFVSDEPVVPEPEPAFDASIDEGVSYARDDSSLEEAVALARAERIARSARQHAEAERQLRLLTTQAPDGTATEEQDLTTSPAPTPARATEQHEAASPVQQMLMPAVEKVQHTLDAQMERFQKAQLDNLQKTIDVLVTQMETGERSLRRTKQTLPTPVVEETPSEALAKSEAAPTDTRTGTGNGAAVKVSDMKPTAPSPSPRPNQPPPGRLLESEAEAESRPEPKLEPQPEPEEEEIEEEDELECLPSSPVIPALDVKNMRWSPQTGLEPASAPAVPADNGRDVWDLPGGQIRREAEQTSPTLGDVRRSGGEDRFYGEPEPEPELEESQQSLTRRSSATSAASELSEAGQVTAKLIATATFRATVVTTETPETSLLPLDSPGHVQSESRLRSQPDLSAGPEDRDVLSNADREDEAAVAAEDAAIEAAAEAAAAAEAQAAQEEEVTRMKNLVATRRAKAAEKKAKRIAIEAEAQAEQQRAEEARAREEEEAAAAKQEEEEAAAAAKMKAEEEEAATAAAAKAKQEEEEAAAAAAKMKAEEAAAVAAKAKEEEEEAATAAAAKAKQEEEEAAAAAAKVKAEQQRAVEARAWGEEEPAVAAAAAAEPQQRRWLQKMAEKKAAAEQEPTGGFSMSMYRTNTAVSTDVTQDMMMLAEEEAAGDAGTSNSMNDELETTTQPMTPGSPAEEDALAAIDAMSDGLDMESDTADDVIGNDPSGMPLVPAAVAAAPAPAALAIGGRIPERYKLQQQGEEAGVRDSSSSTLQGLERLDELHISQSPAPLRTNATTTATAAPAATAAAAAAAGDGGGDGGVGAVIGGRYSYSPPSTEAATTTLEQLEAQHPDKFKKAVAVARTSATLCRTALRRQEKVVARAEETPAVEREDLALALLAAAEVTAYGLASMEEALEGSSHASVRSALSAKLDTMRNDLDAVEAALGALEDQGVAAATPPRGAQSSRSRVSTASTDWDEMSTPRQVGAFAGVQLPATPRYE
eukprot:COSAG06_NODE_927_length_11495_cov_5.212969_2_plen_1088_part_00